MFLTSTDSRPRLWRNNELYADFGDIPISCLFEYRAECLHCVAIVTQMFIESYIPLEDDHDDSEYIGTILESLDACWIVKERWD